MSHAAAEKGPFALPESTDFVVNCIIYLFRLGRATLKLQGWSSETIRQVAGTNGLKLMRWSRKIDRNLFDFPSAECDFTGPIRSDLT